MSWQYKSEQSFAYTDQPLVEIFKLDRSGYPNNPMDYEISFKLYTTPDSVTIASDLEGIVIEKGNIKYQVTVPQKYIAQLKPGYLTFQLSYKHIESGKSFTHEVKTKFLKQAR